MLLAAVIAIELSIVGLTVRLNEWNNRFYNALQNRQPNYLFLDEATAALDEAAEALLYHLLEQRLARATIVSIGHRATLAAFHRRRLVLAREGDRTWLRESRLAPAGS